MGRIWILTDRRYLGQRMPGALVEWLDTHGHRTEVVVADEGAVVSRLTPLPGGHDTSPWAALEPGDLVVARTRHPFALALLKEAEARGARTVDGWAAVVKVRNKVRSALALARTGVRVPPTFMAHRPEALRDLPPSLFPLLLKPFQGDNAQGIRVVEGPGDLSSVDWNEPIVLAQPYLDGDGLDLKIYVAGDSIWATRRPSPLVERDDPPVSAAVTPGLRQLARVCAEVFGLRLVGIDLVESSEGLVVVDVNEFPNYTGIDEAPAAIGRLVLEQASVASGTAVDRLGA